MTGNPFWLDLDYDREYASNGHSRYTHYLNEAAGSFREIYADDPTVEFAAVAWRVATGPIMVPGLVRHHPRVISAEALRSDWNGRLIGSVRLVAPRPAGLSNARTPDGIWYRDLELDSWAGRYEGVGGRDLEHGAYLTTEVQALWQVADGVLPRLTEVPPAGHGRHALALACVRAIVGEFNRQIRPLIEAVES